MVRKLWAAALIAAAPTPAAAAWKSATSQHFVVFTEGSQADARETAEKLEKYFFVLRTMTGARGAESPTKIHLYMMSGREAVRETIPFGGGGGIAGFYNAHIRGPYAVMSRTDGQRNLQRTDSVDPGLNVQHVLFHELTHPFMRQFFPAAYPT